MSSPGRRWYWTSHRRGRPGRRTSHPEVKGRNPTRNRWVTGSGGHSPDSGAKSRPPSSFFTSNQTQTRHRRPSRKGHKTYNQKRTLPPTRTRRPE